MDKKIAQQQVQFVLSGLATFGNHPTWIFPLAGGLLPIAIDLPLCSR
jgi:hypothetical protein